MAKLDGLLQASYISKPIRDHVLVVAGYKYERHALPFQQHHLLSGGHARLFVETFNQAVARINGNQVEGNRALKDRLAIVDQELANRSANMLSGGSVPR